MTPAVFPMSPAARKSRHSIALVLTLAILAILSILLVSFVSIATLDRNATNSYSQSLRAEQVAQGGLDLVVSQIQGEISDPKLSMDSQPTAQSSNLYIPLAAIDAVPQRTAPNLTNLATVTSYSGTPLYTAGSGTTDYSSPSSTLNNSLNGRYLSIARWNKPQLMAVTNGFPAPQWVVMTRGGPQAFPNYTTNLAYAAALNTNFALGRYAYVVYDTSGLIDANVAGYPSSASANASGKGLLPWADLTQITGVTQGDVDNLIAWRNAASSSAGAYPTNVYYAATNNGYMSVTNGDTCFLGRQELIRYAQTQNTDLTNALPYLTTFSREANGPVWGPSTPTGSSVNYAGQQYTAGSFNPRIPNPRVASGFTRNNGLTAVAGESLVKYRFPLDKLALLEKFMGTGAGGLTPTDITNIQKYFGLDVAPDANGPSFRHWNYPTTNPAYVHNSGSSGATGIMSLDDVAALKQGREPDFFELLQAGMLSGSLGAPGTGKNGRSDQQPANPNGLASFIDPDNKTTLQIMRIGANIIDQWDADSYPTTITYTPNAGPASNVEGIEDLPYPFAAYLNMYSSKMGTTGTTGSYTTPLPPFNFYLYFELWNPHQMPATPGANYPTNFRFNPYSSPTLPGNSDQFLAGFINGRVVQTLTPLKEVSAAWFYYGPTTAADTKNGSANSHTRFTLATLAPSGIPFAYSPTAAATDYREPTLAAKGTPAVTGPPPFDTIACLSLPALTNFPTLTAAANQGTSIGFPPTSGPGSPDGAWQCQTYFQMVMPVQYQDTANNWHTYSTFIGMDDQTGAYPDETGYYNYGGSSTVNFPIASLSAPSLAKSDPRTFRFGVSNATTNNVPGAVDYNVPLANSGNMVTWVTSGSPFASTGVSTTAPYRFDMWAANNSSVSIAGPHAGSTTTANNPYYPDVDGVQRQGDAANSYRLSTPTSPLFANATANRPVILNRPFQSVGELGYVYRDMPWKTLDLASANSADSGLLDLFTLSDAPVIAGRVNPNTPYPPVLAALLAGATQSAGNGTMVSSGNALTVAKALQSQTALTPFVSRADMVNTFMTNSAITAMAPSGIKTEEEAAVRAVAESANTRTWNFLIDIIAQSGRYPSTASSLDHFVVEGERRYWLHIAIDRYTGQIVDKQLEVVNE